MQNVAARRDAYDGPKPKYVFLFIGDGYGLAQSEAAEAYLAAMKGQSGLVTLEMNKLPVYGVATTYAGDRLITDSAAAGTALATGRKTSCGTIGMDLKKENAMPTIAERAKARGMRVGIVTSVSIDHATPACFYAHVAGRFIYHEIGLQLGESGFDYFGGATFLKPDAEVAQGPADKPALNCVAVAKARGYRIVETPDAFNKLAPGDRKVIVAPADAKGALAYAIDRKDGAITLKDITRKGIELLDCPEGFFMMVEGGKIDWACHSNDAATTVRDVLDFDDAIGPAMEFYNKHPSETLIVVTSDHETGGFALGSYPMHYESNLRILSFQKGSYQIFASKVAEYRKAHPEGGNLDEAMTMVRDFFGLGDASKGLDLAPDELALLARGFKYSMIDPNRTSLADKAEIARLYYTWDPLTTEACHILDAKAGIGWTSYVHTACPVPVRAIGPSSELYSGYIDNTDIANNIFKVFE
jgi:alkaline phosphatase